MKIRLELFNIYLLSLLLLLPALSGGGADAEAKKTPPDKKHSKESSTLRLYLETTSPAPERKQEVPLFRTKPVMVTIEKMFFLDESSLSEASIIDEEGSFLIKIQFDRHGALLLENMTATNVGKRVVISSQLGDSVRWLAAPLLTRRISDGVLKFTPDASRDEAQQIVNGLNNVIAKAKKMNKL
jgi:preprotein translocase subunit SecD